MAVRSAYIYTSNENIVYIKLVSSTYIVMNSTGMDCLLSLTPIGQSTAIYAIKNRTRETVICL